MSGSTSPQQVEMGQFTLAKPDYPTLLPKRQRLGLTLAAGLSFPHISVYDSLLLGLRSGTRSERVHDIGLLPHGEQCLPTDNYDISDA